MKRWLLILAAAMLCLVCGAAIVVGVVLHLLRPAPGEWSHVVRLGPWRAEFSVPALVRIATHPSALRWLEGRTLRTPFGPVQWRAGTQPNTWQALCSPCRLQMDALGRDEIRLTRVAVTLHRAAQNDWRGEFVLGDTPSVVRGRWKAAFDARGARLQFSIADTSLADAFGLFASVVPEVHRARIDGRIRLTAQLRLPQRELAVQPQIEGFAVSGLGTEALLNAVPGCGALASRGFGMWLPRAVVAAEDQRFYEHTGYDLHAINESWSLNQQQGQAARGGSTLSQQLAKLLFAGDGRHHGRKLRELLYAVELDRTLGKARVLNLYLAMVPWGDGQCGAHAAARHYLGKRADKLTPLEAAWLASLLHNPDREWTQFSRSGQVNVERVGWVIDELRPMRPARREALRDVLRVWAPPSLNRQRAVP